MARRLLICSILLAVLALLGGCYSATDNKSEPEEQLELDNVKETEHFCIYYNDKDQPCIDDVAKQLEGNYDKIVEDLKPGKLPKIKVKIYPSVEEFHKAIKMFNAPEWAVGAVWGYDEIGFVSPLNPGHHHGYDSILKTAVHEFTHCVVNNIMPGQYLPRWLWEGIALYEAGQFSHPKGFKPFRPGNYPTLSRLNDRSSPLIYQVGYTIIEYIVEVWDMKAVRELIATCGNIKQVLGISEEQFEEGWFLYVKTKYLESEQ